MKINIKRSAVVLLLLALIPISAMGQPPKTSGYLSRDTVRKEVIVFVHGVVGDAKDTWTNQDTNTYWPLLIRQDPAFAVANVWVFSYSSPKLSNAQNVAELSMKLGDEMRAQDVFTAHDRVYFIVHSMGGLIVREMLSQQLPPAAKVPLIYFYGTPSAGADLAGVAAAMSSNPQFENLRVFTRESNVADFSRRWLATAENPAARYPQRIWSFCAYEIQPYAAGKLIVQEASATYLCTTAPRAALANHVTMVKPAGRSAEPYQYFVSAYKFVTSSAGQFAASVGALGFHSSTSPGIRTDALELRTASMGSELIYVGCNQSAAGQRSVRVELAPSAKLVAVQPKFQSIAGISGRSLTSTFDPTGSITVGYMVQGVPANPIHGCREQGRAQVEVQYLIEK